LTKFTFHAAAAVVINLLDLPEYKSMNRVLVFLIFLIIGVQASAQQPMYAYIESENRQPFYVLLNGKTYSSSESGYVILPQLNAGTIDFSLGFPKNAYPEQRFKITLDKKDVGFQLKNLDDKGWNLFNFQTLALVPSLSPGAEKKNSALTGEKKTDQFSSLLANVVNDSSILYSATQVQNESSVTTAKPTLIFKDSTLPNNHPLPADTLKATVAKPQNTPPPEQQVVQQKPKADSVKQVVTTASTPPLITKEDSSTQSSAAITKANVDLKKDSTELKTSSAIAEVKDTAAAKPVVTNKEEVQMEKPVVTEPAKTTSSVQRDEKSSTNIAKISEQTTQSGRTMVFLSGTDTVDVMIPTQSSTTEQSVANTTPAPTNTSIAAAPAATGTPVQTKTALTKADCKLYASAQETDRLRVKMIAGKTTADKLAAASKTFKLRCFSVNQIRALAEVYADDSARYQFYELAYLHVSDQYNFRGLSETLSDATVMARFKELVSR
jgi:hypothetical protein